MIEDGGKGRGLLLITELDLEFRSAILSDRAQSFSRNAFGGRAHGGVRGAIRDHAPVRSVSARNVEPSGSVPGCRLRPDPKSRSIETANRLSCVPGGAGPLGPVR